MLALPPRLLSCVGLFTKIVSRLLPQWDILTPAACLPFRRRRLKFPEEKTSLVTLVSVIRPRCDREFNPIIIGHENEGEFRELFHFLSGTASLLRSSGDKGLNYVHSGVLLIRKRVKSSEKFWEREESSGNQFDLVGDEVTERVRRVSHCFVYLSLPIECSGEAVRSPP